MTKLEPWKADDFSQRETDFPLSDFGNAMD